MIKVLEQAIEKVKTLPEERQRYAAEVLEHIAAATGTTLTSRARFYDRMTPAQRDELTRSIAEADRGEGIDAKQAIDELAARHGLPRTA